MPALDGLRGIAILLVLIYHFFLLTEPQSGLWLDDAAAKVVGLGWSGVDLFFVLSGFLITGILVDAKSGSNFFRNFYARRFLRIFPIYYGFLFVLIVVLPQLPSVRGDHDLGLLSKHQFWYWSYLLNVFVAFKPLTDLGLFGNGHFWSLAVEEQFYLCWPAVVFLLGRRSLMLACVACVLGAPVFRFALIEGAVDPLANSLASGVLAPARMDALALGGFLALAARRPEELRRLLRWARPVAWASAFVLLGLFFWRGRLSFFDDWVQTVGYTANAFLFGAILTLAVTAAPNTAVHSVCTHRFLTFFGRYSYALYLFHFQIAALLARRVREAGGLPTVAGLEVPARTVVALLGISSSVILAWLSWHLYEKQFFKLKVLFPYGGRPGGTSNLQRGKL
jgi:peptidoglycan/LPS O-acetylase OafA/YrhL